MSESVGVGASFSLYWIRGFGGKVICFVKGRVFLCVGSGIAVSFL